MEKPASLRVLSLSFLAASLFPAAAHAGVYITEFCSDTGNNEHFEFVEITNTAASPVDLTGWSQDDNHATPGTHSLSALGTLAPGQSAILTEATSAAFRTYWGLPDSIPVLDYGSNDNLSTTADSITLFNAAGQLVDRLDYSAANGGTADEVTRNAPLAALGLNNNSLWVNSALHDSFGSFFAPGETHLTLYGNPGLYAVPEPTSPASLLLALSISTVLTRTRRRESRNSAR